MEQTVRLAADADGVLLAVEHDVVNNANLVDTHVEPATEASKSLYAAPAIRHRRGHVALLWTCVAAICCR